MAASVSVYDFVHRLNWDRQLRARFAEDPAAVLASSGLAEAERKALLDGSFAALAEIGMHPLVQMPYSVARNPGFAANISFRDYLTDLD